MVEESKLEKGKERVEERKLKKEKERMEERKREGREMERGRKEYREEK